MIRLFAVSLIAIAATGSAYGVDCSALPDQNAMNQCAEDAYQKSDGALNLLYGQITTRLADDADGKGLLVKAQRAWVAYRDAECAFQTAGSAGGSIQPMLESMCMDGLTKKRIADFKTYLSCQEGDMSCPVPPA